MEQLNYNQQRSISQQHNIRSDVSITAPTATLTPQPMQQEQLSHFSLSLKNTVRNHLHVQGDTVWDVLGPIVNMLGTDSDTLFHGSFFSYRTFIYSKVEPIFRPQCVVEFMSYLTRQRPLYQTVSDISTFPILQKSDNVNNADLPLEQLIIKGANAIKVLKSSFGDSVSRATACAYGPIFYEAFNKALDGSHPYVPCADDPVEFRFPVQYLKLNPDGNYSCYSALSNDLRPDISLTLNAFPATFVEAEVDPDKFDKDAQKAIGFAVTSFRDIVCMAQKVLFEGIVLNQLSLSFLNRCASGDFVFPFVTCHSEKVTFYCVQVHSADLQSTPSKLTTFEKNPFNVWTMKSFSIIDCENLIYCAAYARNLVDYCLEVVGLHRWIEKYPKMSMRESGMMNATQLKQAKEAPLQTSTLPYSAAKIPKQDNKRRKMDNAQKAIMQLRGHLSELRSEIHGNHLIVFGKVSSTTTWPCVGQNVVIKLSLDDNVQIENEIAKRSLLPPNDIIAPLLVPPFEWMPEHYCLVMKDVGTTTWMPVNFVQIKTAAVLLLEKIQLLHDFGIAHLDLKPSNISMQLNSKTGIPCNLCLLDFGCAREIVNGICENAHDLGTDFYRAPEVASQLRPLIRPEADYYSIGKILMKYFENVDMNSHEKKWLLELIRILTFEVPSERRVAMNFVKSEPRHLNSGPVSRVDDLVY